MAGDFGYPPLVGSSGSFTVLVAERRPMAICSNIGRKSDKIIRKFETLQRKWIFQRFRVKLRHPGKKDKAHALRRHGAQYTIHDQHDRVQGKSDKRMPAETYASRFYSHEVMWEARCKFLTEHEQELKKKAEAIEHAKKMGQEIDPYFKRTVELNRPIGEGLVRVENTYKESRISPTTGRPIDPDEVDLGVKHFSNLHLAEMRLEYENGTWTEISFFPDVREAFRRDYGSGPTIHL